MKSKNVSLGVRGFATLQLLVANSRTPHKRDDWSLTGGRKGSHGGRKGRKSPSLVNLNEMSRLIFIHNFSLFILSNRRGMY